MKGRKAEPERDIERALAKKVEEIGGRCWKFTSPGRAGVPDRICLLRGGKVAFVEVKGPGKKLRPLQRKRKDELEALGFRVHVLDTAERIDELIAEIVGGQDR